MRVYLADDDSHADKNCDDLICVYQSHVIRSVNGFAHQQAYENLKSAHGPSPERISKSKKQKDVRARQSDTCPERQGRPEQAECNTGAEELSEVRRDDRGLGERIERVEDAEAEEARAPGLWSCVQMKSTVHGKVCTDMRGIRSGPVSEELTETGDAPEPTCERLPVDGNYTGEEDDKEQLVPEL
jgi:hypothetical protein